MGSRCATKMVNWYLFKRFMMKKITRYTFIIGLSVVLSSCIKTYFGDYDYDLVPDIQFDDQLSDSYLLNVDDSLQFVVDMASLGVAEEDFSYRWYYYAENTATDGVTPIVEVGASPELNLIGNMATGAYFFIFEAIDNETSLVYYKRMTLNVQRFTSEGWLILTSSGVGEANLSIVTSQDVVYRDFFPLSTTMPMVGNPLEILVVNSPQDGQQPIAIRTDAPQFYFLNRETYEIQTTANGLFAGGSSAQFDFFASDWWAATFYLRDTEGNFYWTSNVDDLLLPEFSGVMGGGYRLAPLAMPTSSSYPIHAMFYDEGNRQFVYQSTYVNNIIPFQFQPEQIPVDPAFDIYNFTDRILFGGPGTEAVQYIVGIDEANNYTLYGFSIDYYTALIYPGVSTAPIVSPSQDELRFFSLSGIRSLLYYMAGNDLYMYRMGEQDHILLYSFPEEERVVACEVFRQPVLVSDNEYFPTMENRICVATNSNGEGFFYTFDLSPTGIIATGTYTDRYDGFPPIIDIAYKMLK